MISPFRVDPDVCRLGLCFAKMVEHASLHFIFIISSSYLHLPITVPTRFRAISHRDISKQASRGSRRWEWHAGDAAIQQPVRDRDGHDGQQETDVRDPRDPLRMVDPLDP